MAEQSGRKLASAHPQKGAQDAAFQEPGLSTKVSLHPRRRLQHFTWGGLRSRVKFSRSLAPPVGVGIQGLSPIAQPGRLRTRSTSHSVAIRNGCTSIPLAAGRAQEDENLSRKRRFRPRIASVRPPGSVRTDYVLRITVLDAWKTGLSSGRPNHGAFDHDPSAHIFPERDQQLSRQRHDRRLAPTTAVAINSVLEPECECRPRLMA